MADPPHPRINRSSRYSPVAHYERSKLLIVQPPPNSGIKIMPYSFFNQSFWQGIVARLLVASLAQTAFAGCATPTQATTWQMMLPPSSGDSAHTTLNPNAPLSSWRPFAQGPYPSNEFCQSAIKAQIEADRREGFPSASHFGFQMAQCVSSDDPRLKGN